MNRPNVKEFFDNETFTYSYVVSDPATNRGIIIDSVLNFNAASGRTSTRSADEIIDHVTKNKIKVDWIIDSHIHADHLSAAHYLQDQLGGRTGIGERVTMVQQAFGEIFNEDEKFTTDGRQFDHLFADNEEYKIGSISAKAIHTPGHTPACMCHVIGDAAFVGDTLFMPDFGTARCDFPGGDAGQLYDSIKKIFELPPETRLFMCHDYKAPGRDTFAFQTTVDEEMKNNIHVGGGTDRDTFVRMRTQKDQTLAVPALILPSVQVNMRAGQFPDPENDGKRFLKVPINTF